MMSSKPRSWGQLFLFALLLNACSFKNRSHETAAAGAAARAALEPSTVTLLSVDDGALDAYGFPTARTYTLKTCLTDKVTQMTPAGKSVTISGGPSKIVVPIADPWGCFTWNENFTALKKLSHEHFIKLHRVFDTEMGQAVLDLAISPWRTTDALRDFRNELRTNLQLAEEAEAAEALSGRGKFAADPTVQPTNLVMGKMTLFAKAGHSDEGGTDFILNSRIALEASRLAYDGEMVREKIHVGKFRVLFPEVASGAFEVSIDKDGFLSSQHSIRISAAAARQPTTTLAYRIEPVETTAGLGAIRGWVRMKREQRDFSGGDQNYLTPPGEVIQKLDPLPSAPPVAISPAPAPMPNAVPEVISPPTPMVVREAVATPPVGKRPTAPLKLVRRSLALVGDPYFKKPNDWVIYAEVKSKACIVIDTVPPLPLTEQGLRVEIADGSELSARAQVRRTNGEGCVEWTETHALPAADSLAPKIKSILLKVEDGDFAGQLLSYRGKLNLAEKGDATFRDTDLDPTSDFEPNPQAGKSSRLQIVEAKIRADEHDYDLNEYLGLTRRWNYTLTLDPRLYREYRYATKSAGVDSALELLPGTEFEVDAVLARPNARPKWRSPDQPSTAEEKRATTYFAHCTAKGKVELVDVGDKKQNRLRVSLMFPVWFYDQPSLRSRMRLYLRVRPLGTGAPGSTILADEFRVPIAGNEGAQSLIVDSTPEAARDFEATLPNVETITKKMDAVTYSAGTGYYPRDEAFRSPVTGQKISPLELMVRYEKGKSEPVKVSLDGSLLGEPKWEMSLDKTPFVEQGVGSSDLTQFLSGRRKLVDLATSPGNSFFAKLCEVFSESDIKSLCQASPTQYLHLARFQVLSSAPTFRSTAPQLVTLEQNVSFSDIRSTTERNHSGKRAKDAFESSATPHIGLELFGVGLTGEHGYAYEAETYLTTETLWNTDVKVERNNNQKQTMTGQRLTLRLNGVFQNCLVVRPVYRVALAHPGKAYFFCVEKREETEESWYELVEPTPTAGSTLANAWNPDQVGFIKLIRGTSNFDRFRLRILRNTVVRQHFEMLNGYLAGPVDPARVENELLPSDYEKLFRDGGSFPGATEIEVYRPLATWGDYKERLAEMCGESRMKQTSDPLEKVAALNFCRCHLDEAEARWTLDDYKKNFKARYDVLKSDGTLALCRKISRGE
jgi:hypothetical protein